MTNLECSPSRIQIDFTDEAITANAGTVFLSRMAEEFDLPWLLGDALQIKKRDRGASDAQMLLSLIYSLAQGEGALKDVDRLKLDMARARLLGLERVPDSRRLGEFLSRFTEQNIVGFRGVARQLCGFIIQQVIEQEIEEKGFIPVFVDGSEIEVDGHYFEKTSVGYTGNVSYWLHSIFIGSLWVSQRLHPGNTDVVHGWQKQLEQDVLPLLAGKKVRVYVRVDNAYYEGKFVEFCEDQGWEYSISVTNSLQKQPLLSQLNDGGDPGWTWISEDQTEEACLLWHQPQGWRNGQAYVVIRTYWDGDQKLLTPRLSFILVSSPDVPLQELVHRHRAKQGQENAQKGPLIEMDLHHPPCSSYLANQAFYTAGQIAQILLMSIKFELLPETARHVGIRAIMRELIRVPGKLTWHAGAWTLKFVKSALRLDWLIHAAERLEYLLPCARAG